MKVISLNPLISRLPRPFFDDYLLRARRLPEATPLHDAVDYALRNLKGKLISEMGVVLSQDLNSLSDKEAQERGLNKGEHELLNAALDRISAHRKHMLSPVEAVDETIGVFRKLLIARLAELRDQNLTSYLISPTHP